jgi:RNA polymerase sigma-32 factor
LLKILARHDPCKRVRANLNLEGKTMRIENDDLASYFRDVRRFSPMKREEEQALARQYRAGDAKAGQKLVTANLRFVVKVANEYKSAGLPFADLVQEGNIGLMRAVSKFEPDRGLRLISYAVWWIRAYIQAYVLRSWSLVRIGTTQAQRRLFFTLAKEYRAFRREGGQEEPDAEVVAKRLSVKPCEVIEMRNRMLSRDVSLESSSRADRSAPLEGFASDGPDAEELLGERDAARVRNRKVRVALSRLSVRERLILERRSMKDKTVSRQAIADEMGVSGERVRQLEVRARMKVRASLESFGGMDLAA